VNMRARNEDDPPRRLLRREGVSSSIQQEVSHCVMCRRHTKKFKILNRMGVCKSTQGWSIPFLLRFTSFAL